MGEQAGEAYALLRRTDNELEQQRRLTAIEVVKTAAAEREASEQRRIAEEAATKQREAEQLKVGGL